MIRFHRRIAWITVLLCSAGTAAAQTIHRRDLADFQAVLMVRPSHSDPQLLDGTLLRWAVAPAEPLRDRPNPSSIAHEHAVHSDGSALDVPGTDVVVVPLQDAYRERQMHVLTFWRARGDSLRFDFAETDVRVGGLGHLQVNQALAKPDGAFYLLTDNLGVDGEVRGHLEVTRCRPDVRKTAVVASRRYHMEWGCAECDTIAAELVEAAAGPAVRFVRSRLAWVDGVADVREETIEIENLAAE